MIAAIKQLEFLITEIPDPVLRDVFKRWAMDNILCIGQEYAIDDHAKRAMGNDEFLRFWRSSEAKTAANIGYELVKMNGFLTEETRSPHGTHTMLKLYYLKGGL